MEEKVLGVEGGRIGEINVEEINRVWLKFYDEGVRPDVEIPVMPVYKILDNTAAKYPNKVAMDFFGSKYTYKQLADASDKVASFLLSRGVEKGDRVIVAVPNTPHHTIITNGILKTGATLVQCNPIYTERELRYIVKNSEATKMFAVEFMYPNLRPLVEDGMFDSVIICKIEDFLKFPMNLLFRFIVKRRKFGKIELEPRSEIASWNEIMRHRRLDREVEINPFEDVAVIQYTGGTTGFPKGAMLTHFNVVANAYQSAEWDPLAGTHDVYLGVMPLFHVYGFTVTNASILKGETILPVPDPRDFNTLLKLIHKKKVTTFCGVPTLFNAILNHPKLHKFNLNSIRICVCAAAPVPQELKRKWEEVTGGKLAEGYGLSEASPATHCNPSYGLNKPGSCGIPFPSTIAAIVDEDGYILPPGEIGEIAIFGPQVMKGYWKMEAETKKVLIDGWLLTGDLGMMDDDGYFYIVDRKKDMIIAGGYNIYPREVEDVLYEHPAVLEAAVVGVPDPYRGETVKAFVVLKPEYKGKVTEKELDRHCRERLAAYKVPRIYEFRDELPKSLVGKILRRVLRDEEMKRAKA